ncbi:MAG TPA: tRNA (adenosine(37)-N6)-threonylcarbamoyltransferase complex dimerization subunit type 1 TsaB [Stellaceae bacterium]|nr:tRNA (adenosine(37)-N6)-threonylcarbamoyltransferase complex dimerization subunit type 1 TsaB [Stellaceae bacterium]
MVNVLAFDCAGNGAAVAVLASGHIAASRSDEAAVGQAERLMPMIEAVCAQAATGFADLDLLAVTVGPGSFTGIRIGLAAARGLALATGLSCLGVTSFAAVAAAVPPELRPLVVALDSRRDEIFVQCFRAENDPDAPVIQRPEDAAKTLPRGGLWLAGDAAGLLLPWLGPGARIVPRSDRIEPGALARLAAAQWRPGEHPPRPQPFYLRAPDTTLPRTAAR